MSLLSSAAYVVPKHLLCGETAHTRQAITAQAGRIYCCCHYYRAFDFVPGDLLLTGAVHELRKRRTYHITPAPRDKHPKKDTKLPSLVFLMPEIPSSSQHHLQPLTTLRPLLLT